MELQLINAVCRKEELWNKNDLNYGDVNAEFKAWKKIASELECHVKHVVKTWNRLKDSFECAHKEVQSKIEETGNKCAWKNSSFQYYNMMMFLKPQEKLDTKTVSRPPALSTKFTRMVRFLEKPHSPSVSAVHGGFDQMDKASHRTSMSGVVDFKSTASNTSPVLITKIVSPQQTPEIRPSPMASAMQDWYSQGNLASRASLDGVVDITIRAGIRSPVPCTKFSSRQQTPEKISSPMASAMQGGFGQMDKASHRTSMSGVVDFTSTASNTSPVLITKIVSQQQTPEIRPSPMASAMQGGFGQIDEVLHLTSLDGVTRFTSRASNTSPVICTKLPSQQQIPENQSSPMASAMQDWYGQSNLASRASLDGVVDITIRSPVPCTKLSSRQQTPEKISSTASGSLEMWSSPMASAMQDWYGQSELTSRTSSGGVVDITSRAGNTSPVLCTKISSRHLPPKKRYSPMASAIQGGLGQMDKVSHRALSYGVENLTTRESNASPILCTKILSSQQTSEIGSSPMASPMHLTSLDGVVHFTSRASNTSPVICTKLPSRQQTPEKPSSPMASAVEGWSDQMNKASTSSPLKDEFEDLTLSPLRQHRYSSPGPIRSKPCVNARLSDNAYETRKAERDKRQKSYCKKKRVLRD